MAWRSLLQWVGGQGHSARDRAPGGGRGLSQRWHLILEEETSRSRCLSRDKGGSVQAQETPSWPVWACSSSFISLPRVVPEGLVVPSLGWVRMTTSQGSGVFSTKGRQRHTGERRSEESQQGGGRWLWDRWSQKPSLTWQHLTRDLERPVNVGER